MQTIGIIFQLAFGSVVVDPCNQLPSLFLPAEESMEEVISNMEGWFAHTPGLSENLSGERTAWEPLFTPFGSHEQDGCTMGERRECEQCEWLAPGHGHLNKVARLSQRFAAEMFENDTTEQHFAAKWAHVVGLWHDLGKFSREFQELLAGERKHAEHSTAGAQYINECFSGIGQLFAYLIAGHHSGLSDWNKNASDADLYRRLRKTEIPHFKSYLPPALAKPPGNQPKAPPFFYPDNAQGIAFFARILFSCLVDADFLATEAYVNPRQNRRRLQWPDDIFSQMEQSLNSYLERFEVPQTKIEGYRNDVRRSCLAAATWKPGFFTLTVPTGGGKTLSSLAFAIRHARLHGLRRIIYVIPYTSIIEQTAQTFRSALKEVATSLSQEGRRNLVLEHHSNFESADEDYGETPVWKLKAENWDSPLVVTTNVQLFESLFASKTSRCRKLHNVVGSVVILDEVQNLPVQQLAPCLEALRQLESLGKCSLVLCTATQPALKKRPASEDCFNRIALDIRSEREIVQNPKQLFQDFRRVSLQSEESPLDDAALAERLQRHERALCIVNTKKHAARLFNALGPGDSTNIHLSAQLCPAYRRALLTEIKRREAAGLPCRVIATTVVEAGVDLDFPVVYRAHTGLDSLAQAAGRCNC